MGKFVVKQTATGYKFDLKAGNGEIIASSEIYTTEAACLKGLQSVKVCSAGEVEDQTAEAVEVKKHPKFELYQDKNEEYRFRLKAKNGQIIATSEAYKTKASCENGIASVKKNAPDAEVVKAE